MTEADDGSYRTQFEVTFRPPLTPTGSDSWFVAVRRPTDWEDIPGEEFTVVYAPESDTAVQLMEQFVAEAQDALAELRRQSSGQDQQ